MPEERGTTSLPPILSRTSPYPLSALSAKGVVACTSVFDQTLMVGFNSFMGRQGRGMLPKGLTNNYRAQQSIMLYFRIDEIRTRG